VKVSIASGASASLPGQWKDVIDLSFEEMKRVKTLVFSKGSKEGRLLAQKVTLSICLEF